MPSDLLMPSDVVPRPPERGRALRWFILPGMVAVLLVGLFVLLAHILTRSAPIETELAAAMKQGLTPRQRVDLSGRVVEMIERPGRGQPDTTLMLLSLGRIWQGTTENTPDVMVARQRATDCLAAQLASREVSHRKAAVLAFVFWKGHPQSAAIGLRLMEKLNDRQEDLDVRIAAAVALGAIGNPSDKDIIDALEQARNLADERQAELAWNAALSLVRLGQPSATGTLLKLLDRAELSQLTVFDRDADARSPQSRKLSELEIERFLVNAIEASSFLREPDVAVDTRLSLLAQSDPSARVRTAAAEIVKRP